MNTTTKTPNGPPQDIAPSDLWAALEQIPRPWKVVDFPRVFPGTTEPVGKVAIWVLTQQEQMACAAEADKFAKELLKERQASNDQNLAYEDIYRNEVSVQVLTRACRDVKDPVKRPAFPSAKLLRQKLSVDELSILSRHYLQVQAEIGPIVAYMTEDEEKAWIARLAEGGQVFPTAALSSAQQDRLLLRLASHLHKCLMGTCWCGSPPSESSTESESETTPQSNDAGEPEASEPVEG